MKISPVLRTATALLTRPSASFCFNKGMLDPSKHIYMNHVPHNVYADYYPIGQYPELHLIGSVAPATYQPQVQAILLQTFNSRYNTNLSEADFLDQRWDLLFRFNNLNSAYQSLVQEVMKDADLTNIEDKGKFLQKHSQMKETVDKFFSIVLKKLSRSIVVRESRWTWLKEQEVRLALSSQMMDSKNVITVEDFLLAYNSIIENLISASHFGFSRSIEQSETAQQKHFFNEINSIRCEGIKDLAENKPENKTFLNRLMRLVHS